MAATGQAHDEARHFYVMRDYLSEIGPVPKNFTEKCSLGGPACIEDEEYR